MAQAGRVRVSYPEEEEGGGYTGEIKRADEEMKRYAQAQRDASGFWTRGFAPEFYEGYGEKMQGAAKRGMELRRGRKRLHELGEILQKAGEEAPERARKKRSATRKRD